MCYGLGDLVLLRQMIEQSESGPERKRLEHRKLDALVGYCETMRCRRQVLLANFGETLAQPCGNCDNCLSPPAAWDGTDAARKALSCVYRTGQRFGAAHLIDVLRGADTERIRQFGHDNLGVHGVGADLDARTWRGVFRQLVSAGLLDADIEGHGTLRLTAEATPLLRGERRLELRSEPPKRERQRKQAGADKRIPAAPIELPEEAVARFVALRQWRSEAARAQNVPAYVIFHDATLRSIALQHPQDLAALAGIACCRAAA